jgi:hypothetical protein
VLDDSSWPVWKGAPDPTRAFAGYRESDIALALVHEPDYFPTLVRLTPVDVQLSGHSHGGQVSIPALGPVVLPPWGRIYHTGLYELKGRFVYTGRGLGMVELPLSPGTDRDYFGSLSWAREASQLRILSEFSGHYSARRRVSIQLRLLAGQNMF